MHKDLTKFAHVDLLFPSKYLKSADLRGRDVTITIEEIEPRHELVSKQGKELKPIIKMAGKDKMWVLNKTNAQSIAKLHGKEVTDWIGKQITIYPTQISVGGELCDCIRVRPTVARPKPKQNAINPGYDPEDPISMVEYLRAAGVDESQIPSTEAALLSMCKAVSVPM